MRIDLAPTGLTGVETNTLVVPVFEGGVPDDAISEADSSVDAIVRTALRDGKIAGKLGEADLLHLPALRNGSSSKNHSFNYLLIVGLGKREKFESYFLARYAGTAIRFLGRKGFKDIAILFPSIAQPHDISFIAEGAISGSFDQTLYQTHAENAIAVDRVTIVAKSAEKAIAEKAIRRGTILGEAINLSRRLAVTPANDMTPTHLAAEATQITQGTKLTIDVLDERRAREEGMGSFLSVAQGSAQPPRFIVLRYNGDPSSNELLAIVAKGITFDSGGISIKPPPGMEAMKGDMTGGASTIAVMQAIEKLGLKMNVVGIIPATENMPGGKATKPGDIVRAMNGMTIEVINTDAEGRLILADGLCYAKKLGATKIIDNATLTGAALIILGRAAGALMSNDDAFAQEFLEATHSCGERYWQLPLYEEYSQQMRSTIADLRNSGGGTAGTTSAGAFLKAFVGETPWIHLDFGNVSREPETEFPWQAKGPTGFPVRALVSYIETAAAN